MRRAILAAVNVVLVFVMALLSALPATAVEPLSTGVTIAYTYDIPHRTALLPDSSTERCPPVAHANIPDYDADGSQPLGALARPQAGFLCTCATYDHPARFAQGDGASATTMTGPGRRAPFGRERCRKVCGRARGGRIPEQHLPHLPERDRSPR